MSRAWVRRFPWSPIMSATGLGGCHAVRVRGFPWTPMSNKLGRVSRAGFVVSQILRSWGWAGAARSGSVVSHGVTRLDSWSRVVSYHERNGAGRVSRCSGPW